VYITNSEFVSVASRIQHAMRMHRIILSSWPLRLYTGFPHYLINGTIFGRTSLRTKCVLIFCITFI